MSKQGISTLVIAAVLLGTSHAASALDVFIDFDGDMAADTNHSVRLGEMFSGTVYASLDDTNGGLVGFGAALLFDDPPLRVVQVAIDPAWNFVPVSTVDPGRASGGGSLPFIADGLFGPAVKLFDVMFNADALGISNLGWELQEAGAGFDNFVAFDGQPLDQQVNFMNAAVNVVPVPAALPMLLSALLAGGVYARRTSA